MLPCAAVVTLKYQPNTNTSATSRHEAIDNVIFEWSIKEYGKVEVRDYTKAIYDNTKSQFRW